MRRGGRENDVVLSCRVRLARNLREFAFPHAASTPDLLEIRKQTVRALEKSASQAPAPLVFTPFESVPLWARKSLIDRHLSSRPHIAEDTGRAIAATDDAAFSLLVNEEDHLRFQSLLPGLQLEDAWKLANRMDDALESYFEPRGGFAFSAEWGYLTACPTNVGTGLRASTMLHLPALEIAGKIERARRYVEERGLILRGTLGEGSNCIGHLHQLSNAATLGLTEDDVLLETEAATLELAAQERAAREQLLANFETPTRDAVGRAFGLLRYAHVVSYEEAAQALSMMRLAHEMNWARGVPRQKFNELSVAIRPAFLQVQNGAPLSAAQRDAQRASILRVATEKIKLDGAFEAGL